MRRQFLFHLSSFVLLGVSIAGLGQLKFSNRIIDWVPQKDPVVQSYLSEGQQSGYKRHILFVVPLTVEIFHPDAYRLAREVGNDLRRLPNVQHTLSVFEVLQEQYPEKTIDQLSKLGQGYFKQHPEGLKAINGKAVNDMIFHVVVAAERDIEGQAAVFLDTLYAYGKELEERPLVRSRPRIGGEEVTPYRLNQLAMEDGYKSIGLSYLILTLLLLLFAGSLSCFVLMACVLLLNGLTSLGIMGILGIPMNVLTVTVPSLVLILGVADVFHIQVHTTRSESALRSVFKPCLFTTLTTMAGFGSLYFSPLPILSEFATATVIGIGFALYWSFYVFWSFRRCWSRRASNPVVIPANAVTLVEKLPRGLFPGLLVACAIWALGLGKLVVDNDIYSYIPRTDYYTDDKAWIEDNYGGTHRAFLFVRPTDSDFSSVSNWEKVAVLDEALSVDADFADRFTPLMGLSPIELSWMVDAALSDEVPAHPLILNRNTIVFSMAPSRDSSSRFVSEWLDKLGHIRAEGLELRVEGYFPVLMLIYDSILSTQVRSAGVAVVVILGTMALIIGNPSWVLIAVLANVASVLVVLSGLAWMQIPLDITTVTILSISLGIVVDDTVHLMWFARRHGTNSPEFGSSVVAATYTSVILCTSFAAMAVSQLRSFELYGGILACVIAAAWLFDLSMVPWLRKPEAGARRDF